MGDGQIHVNRLNLRVPGGDAAAGRRVARAVGHRLSGVVPPSLAGNLGDLTLRVPVAAGATEAETTQAIAAAIGRAIGGDDHG